MAASHLATRYNGFDEEGEYTNEKCFTFVVILLLCMEITNAVARPVKSDLNCKRKERTLFICGHTM